MPLPPRLRSRDLSECAEGVRRPRARGRAYSAFVRLCVLFSHTRCLPRSSFNPKEHVLPGPAERGAPNQGRRRAPRGHQASHVAPARLQARSRGRGSEPRACARLPHSSNCATARDRAHARSGLQAALPTELPVAREQVQRRFHLPARSRAVQQRRERAARTRAPRRPAAVPPICAAAVRPADGPRPPFFVHAIYRARFCTPSTVPIVRCTMCRAVP